MKVTLIANTTWYIYNFRENLIKSLLEDNYIVTVIAPFDKYTVKLENLGVKLTNINIDSKSKNILKEIQLIFNFYKLLKKENTDIILNFTAKPNIYATIVAYILNISIINNIAGLGIGFVKNNFTSLVLKKLYKFSQKKADILFFQNNIDQDLFIQKRIISKNKALLLPGSGVDLIKFKQSPLPNLHGEKFTFLLVARMLYSKGVEDLIKASSMLYNSGIKNFRIQLLGMCDSSNIDSIPMIVMTEWSKLEFVDYLGVSDNVYEHIKKSHCVILPTYYREGTPKSLLEALSVGRPIITTNMPGCKDTVLENKNGYLVRPNAPEKLAKTMKIMINSDVKVLENMCKESRELAENRFDETIIINTYINTIKKIQNDK
jgi:glycosyltransferase involved in cell wall biosynthesis